MDIGKRRMSSDRQKHRKTAIWRDFCVSFSNIFPLENWSKKQHIAIMSGS